MARARGSEMIMVGNLQIPSMSKQVAVLHKPEDTEGSTNDIRAHVVFKAKGGRGLGCGITRDTR